MLFLLKNLTRSAIFKNIVFETKNMLIKDEQIKQANICFIWIIYPRQFGHKLHDSNYLKLDHKLILIEDYKF